MFKNRVLVVIGVISLLMVTMAVAAPHSNASLVTDQGASDFYQRHPEWWWRTTNQNVGIPLTSSSDDAFPDYYQRHPEWTWAVNDQNVIPLTGDVAFPDYYQRHRELSLSAVRGLGASDYFQRHPELTAPAEASVDLTDYYFRQQVLFPAVKTIDLTDYYFRHPELTGK
jgi:hypothetical protein